ncbi:MAG TPA: hypothetical protein VES20_20935, partial [Bryobacteraceae bacterium]|nr:hypothetical protein [Bryobacteraceae bacterium]
DRARPVSFLEVDRTSLSLPLIFYTQQRRFSELGDIDRGRETAVLTAQMRTLHQVFGMSHPIGKQLFATESPEALAAAAINGSALADRQVIYSIRTLRCLCA